MRLTFTATVIEWRGPSPYFYAPVPMDLADDVRHAARLASYGWGVVPVTATIAGVVFTTSLFPKDGSYLLPLKDVVRRQTGATKGDTVDVSMAIAPRER